MRATRERAAALYANDLSVGLTGFAWNIVTPNVTLDKHFFNRSQQIWKYGFTQISCSLYIFYQSHSYQFLKSFSANLNELTYEVILRLIFWFAFFLLVYVFFSLFLIVSGWGWIPLRTTLKIVTINRKRG